MVNFNLKLENRERGPKPNILVIESNPEVAKLYKSWFIQKMGMAVDVVPAGNAIIEKRNNVGMLIVEPPANDEIGNYILKLRDIYPNQHIVIVSQRNDILTEIKNPKLFPNVSALSKPFHMEELGELVDVVSSKDWKKEVGEDKLGSH